MTHWIHWLIGINWIGWLIGGVVFGFCGYLIFELAKIVYQLFYSFLSDFALRTYNIGFITGCLTDIKKVLVILKKKQRLNEISEKMLQNPERRICVLQYSDLNDLTNEINSEIPLHDPVLSFYSYAEFVQEVKPFLAETTEPLPENFTIYITVKISPNRFYTIKELVITPTKFQEVLNAREVKSQSQLLNNTFSLIRSRLT